MTDTGPLVIVTRRLPYGEGETFLIPELRKLAELDNVILLPSHWGTRVVHGDAHSLCRLVPSPLQQVRWLLRALTNVRASLAAIVVLVALALHLPPRRALRTLTFLPRTFVVLGATIAMGARHVHVHWATDPAAIALAATRATGVPWSFTAHRYDIVQDESFGRKAASARFVRFISKSGKAMAEEYCGGYRPRQEHVVHLGVDVPDEPVAPGGPGGEVIVACPAALRPVKGHATLLAAFATAVRATSTPIRLLLFGDGPLRSSLEAQARLLGIQDSVTFAGLVSHDRLLGRYAAGGVDVVVLASQELGGGVHEGIPVALMEAMAHGIPVVATTPGGVPELVAEAGVLVKPDDVPALAEELRKLADDPTVRARMGAICRRRIVESFDAEQTSRLLLHCIDAGPTVRQPPSHGPGHDNCGL